jgi:hypothetical protein
LQTCAATYLKGRAAVLDARLDVYSVNVGNASAHSEAARTTLRAADQNW